MVSLPQAKIFINGVIKGQNQAIGMILHITIQKYLPRDKKGGGVKSIPEGGGVYFCSRGAADFSHQRGGTPLVHLYSELHLGFDFMLIFQLAF